MEAKKSKLSSSSGTPSFMGSVGMAALHWVTNLQRKKWRQLRPPLVTAAVVAASLRDNSRCGSRMICSRLVRNRCPAGFVIAERRRGGRADRGDHNERAQ